MTETTPTSANPRSARVYQLEHYRFTHNLPPEMRNQLKEIFAHWSDSERAERLVREIIDQAPDSLGVRIVAYRFYFYRRRSAEAAHWALSCMDWLADQLKIPKDWQAVTPDMADFRNWHAYSRLWLQSLAAYAYNMARLKHITEALHALDKLQELDPQDRVGTQHLRQIFTHPDHDAGMLFPKEYEHWRFSPVTDVHSPSK